MKDSKSNLFAPDDRKICAALFGDRRGRWTRILQRRKDGGSKTAQQALAGGSRAASGCRWVADAVRRRICFAKQESRYANGTFDSRRCSTGGDNLPRCFGCKVFSKPVIPTCGGLSAQLFNAVAVGGDFSEEAAPYACTTSTRCKVGGGTPCVRFSGGVNCIKDARHRLIRQSCGRIATIRVQFIADTRYDDGTAAAREISGGP
jgi:hypothetical protein